MIKKARILRLSTGYRIQARTFTLFFDSISSK